MERPPIDLHSFDRLCIEKNISENGIGDLIVKAESDMNLHGTRMPTIRDLQIEYVAANEVVNHWN